MSRVNRLVQVNELAWTLGDSDRDGDNDGTTYESAGDGDVDADDYAVFLACHGASGVPPTPPGCYHAATVESTTGQLADGSDRLGPMVVQFVYP